MTLKLILAVLAAAVVGFFLGWLVYGLLLTGFFEANMTSYDGLMKEDSPIWGYIIMNLSWGIMFVYVFHALAGIKSFGKGFVAGLIITFLVALSFDVSFFNSMNIFNFQALIVDVIVSAVIGGLMAGVAALILGMGPKEEI